MVMIIITVNKTKKIDNEDDNNNDYNSTCLINNI